MGTRGLALCLQLGLQLGSGIRWVSEWVGEWVDRSMAGCAVEFAGVDRE